MPRKKRKLAAATADDAEPYPAFARPSPSDCRAATAALVGLHGARDRPSSGSRTVLDSLVSTMLSQNTTDVTSARAFAQLKAAFPTWQAALTAPHADVAAAIRCCGLADIRAERIQAVLRELRETQKDELSLEHLRSLPTEEVKQALQRFKGVGPKTASCVCMFNLGRADFPVDTHVAAFATPI